MPIKKHLAHQSRYIVQALHSFSLPEWTYSRPFRLSLVGLLSMCSILYVMALSQASVSGYQIRSLEKSIEQLSREQQKLEVAVMERSSLVAISKRMNSLTMVPAEKIIRLNGAPAMARTDKKP